MAFMLDASVSLLNQSATSIFELIEKGKPWERKFALTGSVGLLVGAAIAVSAANKYVIASLFPFGIAISILAFILLTAALSSFEYHKSQIKVEAVNALEQRARAEPAEPQLAWDLARVKLESYLDRNLKQVSSIFYLTTFVMLIGMCFISVGIWRAINVPSALEPAAIAALAGIIVQIIGGTFLLVYRSTMTQAKDYVIVLERINAVGMSINILEGIESEVEMRDRARVQLSTSLLGMYSLEKKNPDLSRPAKNKFNDD